MEQVEIDDNLLFASCGIPIVGDDFIDYLNYQFVSDFYLKLLLETILYYSVPVVIKNSEDVSNVYSELYALAVYAIQLASSWVDPNDLLYWDENTDLDFRITRRVFGTFRSYCSGSEEIHQELILLYPNLYFSTEVGVSIAKWEELKDPICAATDIMKQNQHLMEFMGLIHKEAELTPQGQLKYYQWEQWLESIGL